MLPRSPRIGCRRIALASTAALALLCRTAPAQEHAAPPTEVTEQSASAATPSSVAPPAVATPDPALEILLQAARYQRGETPRALPATLHGRFHVGVRDKDGALIQADVERWYTRAPERLLTTRTESVTGSSSSVGWDGQVAWFRDLKSGQAVIYSDEPETFAEDLDLMQEQVRLTRLWLDAAVLDALIPRLVHPALGGPSAYRDIDDNEHAATIVTAQLPDEVFGPAPGAPPPMPGDAPPLLALSFVIDQTTGALWSLRVSAPHRPDLAALTLRFDLHGLTRGGLHVPGNVRVFRGDETRPEAQLGVELLDVAGQERLLFDIDEPVDPALFAPPAASR